MNFLHRPEKNRSLCLVLTALWLAWTATASALGPADLAALQRAGIGPELVSALTREKAVETGLVTVDDLVALKAAGVTEATLLLVVENGSFLKNRQPRILGSGVRPVQLATVRDLVDLKTAGMDEQTLRAVILAGAASTEEARRQQAMEWLGKMGLRIDTRETTP